MIIINAQNKSQVVLKEQKRFKERHILLVIDNCENDSTLDYDAEALLTIDEAKELIAGLQKMIDSVE